MEDTKAKPFIHGLGRRKRAVAQVKILHGGTGTIKVNQRAFDEFIPVASLRQRAEAPLVAAGLRETLDVEVAIQGGGISGQADAIRLGIARALIKDNPDLRPVLKKEGFLSRDARVKERKKYGLKKARRSPQWSKR